MTEYYGHILYTTILMHNVSRIYMTSSAINCTLIVANDFSFLVKAEGCHDRKYVHVHGILYIFKFIRHCTIDYY